MDFIDSRNVYVTALLVFNELKWNKTMTRQWSHLFTFFIKTLWDSLNIDIVELIEIQRD